MTIEAMRPEHLGEVKALLDTCFGSGAWSADSLRAQLENPVSRCTVALKNGAVVGFLAFEQIAEEGSVVELAVHPSCRRQGIARRLIERAITFSDGLHTVFLEVRAGNRAAVSLYEGLGFERIGVRKGYYDHPREDALIMKKQTERSWKYEDTGY